MQAGDLDRRVQVQSFTETRDSHGGIVRTYSTEAKRFAQIRSMTSREFIGAQQAQSDATHEIILRRYKGLTSEHRIVDDTDQKTYEIEGSPRHFGKRDSWTRVLAKVAE